MAAHGRRCAPQPSNLGVGPERLCHSPAVNRQRRSRRSRRAVPATLCASLCGANTPRDTQKSRHASGAQRSVPGARRGPAGTLDPAPGESRASCPLRPPSVSRPVSRDGVATSRPGACGARGPKNTPCAVQRPPWCPRRSRHCLGAFSLSPRRALSSSGSTPGQAARGRSSCLVLSLLCVRDAVPQYPQPWCWVFPGRNGPTPQDLRAAAPRFPHAAQHGAFPLRQAFGAKPRRSTRQRSEALCSGRVHA